MGREPAVGPSRVPEGRGHLLGHAADVVARPARSPRVVHRRRPPGGASDGRHLRVSARKLLIREMMPAAPLRDGPVGDVPEQRSALFGAVSYLPFTWTSVRPIGRGTGSGWDDRTGGAQERPQLDRRPR